MFGCMRRKIPYSVVVVVVVDVVDGCVFVMDALWSECGRSVENQMLCVWVFFFFLCLKFFPVFGRERVAEAPCFILFFC